MGQSGRCRTTAEQSQRQPWVGDWNKRGGGPPAQRKGMQHPKHGSKKWHACLSGCAALLALGWA
eukprot:211524-Amphidinium_carterae.2